MAPSVQERSKINTPAKPKPFTPALSSSFRNAKSPLTPKLAGSKPASPATSPPRRPARTESQIAAPRRDEVRSPIMTKLNGNITPRSGARNSRTGLPSPSTPASTGSATPSKGRPFSAVEPLRSGRKTLTPTPSILNSVSKHTRSPTTTSDLTTARKAVPLRSRRSSTGTQLSPIASPPTFFRAGDAHSTLPPKNEEASRDVAFFFARDAQRTNSPELLSNTPKLSPKLSPDGTKSKFFYANEDNSPPVTSLNMRMANIRGLSPSATTPVVSPSDRRAPRPASPIKMASFRSAPSTSSSLSKVADSPSETAPPRPQTPPYPRRLSIGSKTPTTRDLLRRPSITSSPPSTFPPHLQRAESQPAPETHLKSASPHRTSPRSVSISSATTGLSVQSSSTTSIPSNPIAYPKADPQPALHRSDSLAANARRERKVLDLEISNSSLLAINRTLEREMRKQSTELRRFRRLSRSGRLSLAASVRSTSGLSSNDDHGLGISLSLSDLEEESDASSDSNSTSSHSDSRASLDDESSLLSPASTTSHTLHIRHRARDEKRLMADLAKHRQLLIDSQKMDASIKRCLAWSEELITEGRRALEYSVCVHDVKLGGRVLGHEDDGDAGEPERSQGLLSPGEGRFDFGPPVPAVPPSEVITEPLQSSLEQLQREVAELDENTFKARAIRAGMVPPDAFY